MIIEYGQEMFSHRIHNGSGKRKSVAVNGMPLVCVRHCAKHVKRPPRTYTHTHKSPHLGHSRPIREVLQFSPFSQMERSPMPYN